MAEKENEKLNKESKVSAISAEELEAAKGSNSASKKNAKPKSWEELFYMMNEADEREYLERKKNRKGEGYPEVDKLEKKETSQNVQSISAEELAAAKEQAPAPVINEKKPEGSSHVSAISAEELAAAKAGINPAPTAEKEVNVEESVSDESIDSAQDMPELDPALEEVAPVKNSVSEEILKRQQEDEEMLSMLDEETRKEYEYLAKKYSYNPINAQNNLVEIATGDYDEHFDFEKRTDIKKVSLVAKRKPIIIAAACVALFLAIFLPIYFLVIAKPKVEPVVLTGLTINQKDVYAYTNTYIDLRNVYLIASYSDGTTKNIACSTDKITSKPSFIANNLYLADTNYTAGKMQFTYEGMSVSMDVYVCKVSFDGINAEVFNANNILTGEKIAASDLYLTKNYSAANVVDRCGTENPSDDYDRLPRSFVKAFTADDYSKLSVTLKKAGAEDKVLSWADIANAGGIVFEEAGEYTLEFAFEGKTCVFASVISVTDPVVVNPVV